jgi:hypothetical protein
MAHPVYQDIDRLSSGTAPKMPPPASQGDGAPRAPSG